MTKMQVNPILIILMAGATIGAMLRPTTEQPIESSDSGSSDLDLRSIEADHSTKNFTDQWRNIEERFNERMGKVYMSLFQKLVPIVNEADLSGDCIASLLHMHRQILLSDTQTFRFLDSSGKLVSGFIQGTMTEFGNFRECMDSQIISDGYPLFKGQYCLAELMLPLPPRPHNTRGAVIIDREAFRPGSLFEHFANHSAMLYSLKFRQGLCVPSTCAKEDVEKIFTKLTESLDLESSIAYCHQGRGDWEFSTLITISMLLVIAFIPVTVTVYKIGSLIIFSEAPEIPATLNSLSIDSTLKKIFDTSRTENSDELKFVHGFRVISLIWIIMGHCYAYLDMNSLSDPIYIERALKSWDFQLISNSWLIVESFFCLSGFLLAHHTLRAEASWALVPMKIVLRYWRLIPLAIIVLSFQFIFAATFEGPLIPLLSTPMTESCKRTWWHLLIGYYDVETESSCLPHLWYVAVDFKLFVIQLPLSMMLMKSPRLGVLLHFIAIGCSAAYAGLVSYFYDLPPIIPMLENRHLAIEVGRSIYFDMRTHLGSYAIGSLAAFYATKIDKKHFKPFRVIVQNILWIIALGIGLAMMSLARLWLVGETPDIVFGAMYAGLQRPLWSLFIGWVLFACSTGNANLTTRILGLPQMIPISRISYVIYLVHAFILYLNIHAAVERKEATHAAIIRDGSNTIVWSTLLALIVSCCFEAPIIFLQKHLLKSHNSGTSKLKPFENRDRSQNVFRF